ncbi:coiled-coil domain-containing protein 30 isoform X1 [Thunnus albacares]|uniref:coiled-coil domain-containing protein 30 isoform X1 n=1 Tax=Thunnus albacares TaxID=8236 RepID=UPI001CF61338|nr:coiled-coil domain-containing protein 30 isoform X1 [Thunnus albacares]XP_044205902.1 coiled-coil domain-containing protein 30 isoform X1 [Thunnus albacares]
MDQPQQELEQIATWFSEEGLAPDAPKEAQLCLLWRTHQHTRSQLSSVIRDMDTQRSQHLAEMAEVRRSLEQIRIFTEHKNVLAQEIQDENDQLKDQLRRLISLQDAQISEVAKMLYQQGLTELIHSSPSEQVAYLLVERASLLETREEPDNLTRDGQTASPQGTDAQGPNINVHQSPHKGAPRHGQSPWKRLFGLHKASQSKHTFIPAEARHLAVQASSVEKECSRLERDLEEGSRRLAMAHNEIRRLTDELESAHLTQKAYEPELQGAQQEVEQLRQEVEKLKKYEMVELRKAKELNDRLDLEIRALRNRVRSLDAEKNSLQQTVASLQEEVDSLESALQEQQQLLTVQGQSDQTSELNKSQAAELAQSNQTCRKLKEKLTAQTRCLLEKEETVVFLQKEVDRLESALQEQQQQLLAVQVQAEQANELAKSQETELNQSNEMCRNLQNKLSAQTRSLLESESEIHSLKQQLDNSHKDFDDLIATICTKENNFQDQKLWKQKDSQHCENSHRQLEASLATENKEIQTQLYNENTLPKECPDYQETVKALLATQDECETLKKEICETLICLDKERSKYHEMKEKHKAKLCRAKQKFDDEATRCDEKIKNLERELSLCSHSLAQEKELIRSITAENEKLLVERRRLLQQLNEEEHNKKDSNLTASLSKCRVDFLEMENKKLGNKILHMSNQLAALERTLQNTQSLHFTEELKKKSNPQQIFTSLPVQTSSVMMPEPSEILGLLDNCQSTSSPHHFISAALSRSAEMGYLNLTSGQSRSDYSTALGALSTSEKLGGTGGS